MSTRLAPVHGGRRAAADALEGGGLGGEVLAVVTQRADGVRGHHVAPPPSQRRPQHARAGHDAPVVRRLGPHRHVGAAPPPPPPAPLLPHPAPAAPPPPCARPPGPAHAISPLAPRPPERPAFA